VIDGYGILFRRVLFPGWERGIRRRPTLEHLASLRRSQWFGADRLRALQSIGFERLLEHAYRNVPFYRKRMDEVGLRPEAIHGIEDLRSLPLLTREEARRSLAERSSTAPPLPEIKKTTSGTSGNPLPFAYDRGSEWFRQAVKLRGYGWAHYELGDQSLHYWGSSAAIVPPPALARAKIRLDHALKREHFVDCAVRSDASLRDLVVKIRQLRPKVLLCYAQAGAALARYVLDTGSELPGGMSVITAAERLFRRDREALTRAFGPDVFESYGSREFMLIASECDAHDGLHVSMENLIVELIVRDGGGLRAAEPGEVGEVVVTDLHNYGAPFIRYLNGDLATRVQSGRCACGRELDRLRSIEGRVSDTLRDAEGRSVSSLFFNVMFTALADKVSEFQVVQRRDGSIDLSVVPARGFDQDTLQIMRRSSAKYLAGVELRTHVVPEIPVEANGKLSMLKVER
jgi:phenylacetate-coenzyme A ligase PaaK-like adenylate-forming protein